MNRLSLIKSINNISLVKTMNRLSLIKSINNISLVKTMNRLSLVKSINNISLVKTMNRLSLVKSINNLTHMKNVNNITLVKTIIEQDMRTRVLRRPIVFLGVRCSILSLWHRSFSIPQYIVMISRHQWPRGLRRVSAVARLLGLRVLIPPGSRISASCECCVFSGREISASG